MINNYICTIYKDEFIYEKMQYPLRVQFRIISHSIIIIKNSFKIISLYFRLTMYETVKLCTNINLHEVQIFTVVQFCHIIQLLISHKNINLREIEHGLFHNLFLHIFVKIAHCYRLYTSPY